VPDNERQAESAPVIPRVAVIVVNYNSGPHLARCLAALAAQRFRDFTVVVVDNGSADESLGALESLPPGWRSVRLTYNAGFAAANNRALGLVESPWIAMLNPDAFAEPDWLDQMMLGVARYPDAAAFGSLQIDEARPDRLDGDGDAYHGFGVYWRGGFGQPIARQGGEGEVFSVCAAAALYNREILLELGGFDEDFFCYGEDVDLGFRLRLAGYRSVQLANAVVRHVGGGSGGGRNGFALFHGHRNRLWLLAKNMPASVLWPLLPVYVVMSLALLLRATILGQGIVVLRALGAGLRGLPKAWAKRQNIQRNRRGNPVPLMAWSPRAVLMRRPFIARSLARSRLRPAQETGVVGVAMVSYQTGPVLMAAIDAVLADPLVEKLVVADNGNPPVTRAQLVERATAEPRLLVIQGQGNIGFAAGCNLAVRHLDQDFLLLLNPDCILPAGSAALLKDELKARERPALLGAVMVDEEGRPQRATRRRLPTPANLIVEALHLYRLKPDWQRVEIEDTLSEEATDVPVISGAAMFLTRANFWALGGLDTGYFLHVEDIDFCDRFAASGGDVVLLPKLQIRHLRSSSATQRLFVEWHKTRGFRRYFRWHAPSAGWRLLLELALFVRLGLLAIVLWPLDRWHESHLRSGGA
jgi:N-acetylglucosaminyl-diphospho-decaprenol L-rhamnosyltransferase